MLFLKQLPWHCLAHVNLFGVFIESVLWFGVVCLYIFSFSRWLHVYLFWQYH